jgi:glucose-1-phosphate cytidylyltransferase
VSKDEISQAKTQLRDQYRRQRADSFINDSWLHIVTAAEFIGKQRFFCTYGDGLSDVNISKLLDFHIQNQKTATLTAVKPQSRFGILDINKSGTVEKFSEKPEGDTWINGGYFVFEPEIFNKLSENTILEREPLENLVVENELTAFKHTGFWQPMDTFREFKLLNEMWETNKAPWKVWE